MMTALMMKLNVSYNDMLNMEFHTIKNLLNTLVDLTNQKEK